MRAWPTGIKSECVRCKSASSRQAPLEGGEGFAPIPRRTYTADSHPCCRFCSGRLDKQVLDMGGLCVQDHCLYYEPYGTSSLKVLPIALLYCMFICTAIRRSKPETCSHQHSSTRLLFFFFFSLFSNSTTAALAQTGASTLMLFSPFVIACRASERCMPEGFLVGHRRTLWQLFSAQLHQRHSTRS